MGRHEDVAAPAVAVRLAFATQFRLGRLVQNKLQGTAAFFLVGCLQEPSQTLTLRMGKFRWVAETVGSLCAGVGRKSTLAIN